MFKPYFASGIVEAGDASMEAVKVLRTSLVLHRCRLLPSMLQLPVASAISTAEAAADYLN